MKNLSRVGKNDVPILNRLSKNIQGHLWDIKNAQYLKNQAT